MTPRIHPAGESALLMDVAAGPFDLELQKRLWSLVAEAGGLRRVHGVRDVVLGVNNVLVLFDPLRVPPQEVEAALRQAWAAATPAEEGGRLVEVPVVYDRSHGSELEGIARHAGLGVDEVVRLHAAPVYHVACIGSVPGFPYLVGMAPVLSMPRHTTPRARVPKGTVAIGGAQTGIIPMDMPSGWHALGRTGLELFDPLRDPPCLLAAGDRVQFTAVGAAP
jgi:KipI family sensor histidine kinase inhibitor